MILNLVKSESRIENRRYLTGRHCKTKVEFFEWSLQIMRNYFGARFSALACCLLVIAFSHSASFAQTTSLKFETMIARSAVSAPQKGRLFIFIGRKPSPEPRFAGENVSLDAPPLLAKDIDRFVPGETTAVIDNDSISYPIKNLSELPAGEYYVQALFDVNIDVRSLNAPDNLYSEVQKVNLDPKMGSTIKLELTKVVPPEQLPADTDYVKFLKLQSPMLSKFHGRPIFLRVGIVLPRDYATETDRRYPLLINIGGYGSKFTRASRMMADGSQSRKAWLADDTPRMIAVYLDEMGRSGIRIRSIPQITGRTAML